MATITGTINCIDDPNAFINRPSLGLSGYSESLWTMSTMDATSYFICQTFYQDTGKTFEQGQLLLKNDLPLCLKDSTYVGGTLVDGTYVGGLYRIRKYNPLWINYGLFYQTDSTTWLLEGYRYRTPLNPSVGHFHANFEAPFQVGTHKIQWLYQKDQSSCVKAIDQYFQVDHWDRGGTCSLLYSYTSATAITVPMITVPLIGESVTFSLVMYGTLPALLTYQWRKGGVNLVDDSVHFSGSQTNTLTVSNITLAEGSFYDCIISGVIQSSPAWLIVDP